MNQISFITPYVHDNMWVFDDPEHGLVKEPFIAGADMLMTYMSRDIPQAYLGFNLLFSSEPFPGYEHEYVRLEPEVKGWWYGHVGTKAVGWLCPAMFKYFEDAPERIYCKAQEQGDIQ